MRRTQHRSSDRHERETRVTTRTYFYRCGPFRLHLDREGAAAATLYLHDNDPTGIRLHKPDIQDVLSRVRVLEVGYDRWGQPLHLRNGAIIFEPHRTRTRSHGHYRATPSTLGDILAVADGLADYLEARRRVCKYCGNPLEEDAKARAAHPECRRRVTNQPRWRNVQVINN